MTFKTRGVRVIRHGEGGGLVSGAMVVQGMASMVFNRYLHIL